MLNNFPGVQRSVLPFLTPKNNHQQNKTEKMENTSMKDCSIYDSFRKFPESFSFVIGSVDKLMSKLVFAVLTL